MMMLNKTCYFCSVVEPGPISNTSQQHGISAAAGSRWITELENSLGVTLLHGTTRKLKPTPDGLDLYERFAPRS